jgi:hypothetical protein
MKWILIALVVVIIVLAGTVIWSFLRMESALNELREDIQAVKDFRDEMLGGIERITDDIKERMEDVEFNLPDFKLPIPEITIPEIELN